MNGAEWFLVSFIAGWSVLAALEITVCVLGTAGVKVLDWWDDRRGLREPWPDPGWSFDAVAGLRRTVRHFKNDFID